MTEVHDSVRAIAWQRGALRLLDQRLLPRVSRWRRYTNAPDVAAAIRDMVVRGAPAIGITAAYGVVLACRQHWSEHGAAWREAVERDMGSLAASRPTAVNLFWAIERMRGVLARVKDGVNPARAALAEAQRVHEEDIEANRRMGELGASLIRERGAVLTHCNAGALATGGFGTALGVVRAAFAGGSIDEVFADETRPWLQGARLTAWELLQDHIPVTLVAEGAAAHLLRQGRVRWVIVGADRIAANGDTANKIGTYGLAVLARQHGVKFMVVAPTSTIDRELPDGSRIPIEMRSADELLGLGGRAVAAAGAQAWNPVFDVTPAGLIDAIVTEWGVVFEPDAAKIARLLVR